ncbi:MAG: hypothetical protein KJ757_05740 [Planctomycetes bacterium]|nr:hypothetical protein [Planctomycetota bacterium]MBU1518747.1 hypothetical protein [Planctomycetota bacterium]MBU2457600.1 hypothetical protein [Planctomycetota bacterium]MBU2597042.1 hypothetical protein [Planctomycetota bacterium]
MLKTEEKEKDIILDKAKEKAIKSAVANHTFGKSYTVSIKQGQTISIQKK